MELEHHLIALKFPPDLFLQLRSQLSPSPYTTPRGFLPWKGFSDHEGYWVCKLQKAPRTGYL